MIFIRIGSGKMIKLFMIWMLNHAKPLHDASKTRMVTVYEVKQTTQLDRLVSVLQTMGVAASVVKRPVQL